MSEADLILKEVRSLRGDVARLLGTRITREQYADRLGVSLSTFDRMNKAGQTAKPLRGKWLLADVIAFDDRNQ